MFNRFLCAVRAVFGSALRLPEMVPMLTWLDLSQKDEEDDETKFGNGR